MLQETSVTFDPCWGGGTDSPDIVVLMVAAAVAAIGCYAATRLLETWRDRIPWKRLRWLWPASWTGACVAGAVWAVATDRTASFAVLLEPPLLIACGVVWTFAYGTTRLAEWLAFRRREPFSLGLK